jgi:hypothetical protein
VNLGKRENSHVVKDSDWIVDYTHRYNLVLRRTSVTNGFEKGWHDTGLYKIRYCPECGRVFKPEDFYEG